ncbi:MAG TPA: carboxypeptidase-like regulatory domain-containing protein [Pyrinomonadaceae bacterium]|jgi:hypothetical protein
MLSKRNLGALAAFVILVVCACVSAQTQPQVSTPASSSTEEPTGGSITGSVVNESGQPLAGVMLFVRNVNPTAGAGRSATTDSEGSFRVKNLDPALYYVTAYFPAYVSQPVDPGATTTSYYRVGDSVRIEMVRGAVITGTVTNSAGEPVIGVRVRAAMIRNAKGEAPRFGITAYLERTTDDRGIYRLFGLPAGTYLVSAGGSASAPNFVLNPYDTDAPTYAPSATRDSAAEVTVRAAEETGVDIRYRGESGHSVSGSVKMTGTTTNASITLTPVGSVIAMANAAQMPASRGFVFNGIPDGEYDIVAQEMRSSASPTLPDLLMSEPRRITVKGADVTGLDLVTRPLGSISGRIVLEPSKASECQRKRQPLFAEMLVSVQRPEKKDDKETVTYLRILTSSTSPDANGNFTLRNLMPNRYLLDPRFYARYWYLNSIGTGVTPKIDAAANWTTVKAGDQLANFTITLAGGAASIRGRVTAEKGPDVPAGLGVYLVPGEREKVADVLRYFVASVAADGTFAFNNLPPGRYLSLLQTLAADTSTLAKLRLPEADDARTKLLRAAEAQKTNVELKPCQNLTDFQLAAKQ